MKLIETDKAYLAGLIDGEGCITISKHNSKRTPTPIYSLALIITSVDKDVLDYWQGKTEVGGVSKNGRGTGKKDKENWRQCWKWWISSKQAYKILKSIYPYLMLKKEQADIAFKFQETMGLSFGGKGAGCIKGGKKVLPEILHQRERYKQALTKLKGYKTRRGRPPS